MNASGMILTTFMIATMPHQLVGALNMLETASKLKEMTALVQVKTDGVAKAMQNPEDIAALCPLIMELAKGAGPEGEHVAGMCAAIQSGQPPEVVMAKAEEAMAMLASMQ